MDSLSTAHARSRATSVLSWIGAVVVLSFIFGIQEVMWHRLNGASVPWLRDIADSSVDWIAWGLVAPVAIMLGRRIRLDTSERRGVHVVGWIGLAIGYWIVASLISGLLLRAFPTVLQMPSIGHLPLSQYLVRWIVETGSSNLTVFAATAAGFHALLYYRDLRARQMRERVQQERLVRAELSALRSQLQPHFLFNALHTISALMVSDVAAAQRVVTAVGDLLRASLDQTQHETTLREEMAFVERYLDVQTARFRNRLTVDVNVPDDALDALVPSFVFQPLVENAVRHGIEPSLTGGRIWLRAGRRDGVLSLEVENDGPTLPAEPVHGVTLRRGNGIGLSNLDARVRQLYGAPHGLEIARGQDGRFGVTVTIPFHTVPMSRFAAAETTPI